MQRQGFATSLFAGVICNVMPEKKAPLCKQLFATYHFDDQPGIIESMPGFGVLVQCTQTPGNWLAMSQYNSVVDWLGIGKLCCVAPQHHVSFAVQQGELEL